jgi:hypothetical protein
VKESGVVLKLEYRWDCDFTYSYSCDPELEMKRVDNMAAGAPTGFEYDRFLYYKDENGTLMRDRWRTKGIRLLMSSEGIAK